MSDYANADHKRLEMAGGGRLPYRAGNYIAKKISQ